MREALPSILTEHHSISSGLVTVPLIRKGQVDGYLMAGVSLTASDEAFLHRGYPVNVDLTDQLMTVLESGAPTMADANFTMQRLRDDLVGQMNQRLGMQVFYRALVQRLDYITPNDMERMRYHARNQMTVTRLSTGLYSTLCLCCFCEIGVNVDFSRCGRGEVR